MLNYLHINSSMYYGNTGQSRNKKMGTLDFIVYYLYWIEF